MSGVESSTEHLVQGRRARLAYLARAFQHGPVLRELISKDLVGLLFFAPHVTMGKPKIGNS
jgi:hypothetical protein